MSDDLMPTIRKLVEAARANGNIIDTNALALSLANSYPAVDQSQLQNLVLLVVGQCQANASWGLTDTSGQHSP